MADDLGHQKFLTSMTSIDRASCHTRPMNWVPNTIIITSHYKLGWFNSRILLIILSIVFVWGDNLKRGWKTRRCTSLHTTRRDKKFVNNFCTTWRSPIKDWLVHIGDDYAFQNFILSHSAYQPCNGYLVLTLVNPPMRCKPSYFHLTPPGYLPG